MSYSIANSTLLESVRTSEWIAQIAHDRNWQPFFFLLHLLRSLGIDVILDQIADNVEAHLYLTFFFVSGMLNLFPIRTNYNWFIKTRFHCRIGNLIH